MAYFKVSKGFSKEPSVRLFLQWMEDYLSGYVVPEETPGSGSVDGTFVFAFDAPYFGESEQVEVKGQSTGKSTVRYEILGNSDGAKLYCNIDTESYEVTDNPPAVIGTNTPLIRMEQLGFKVLESESSDNIITFVAEARHLRPFYMTKASFWIRRGMGVDAWSIKEGIPSVKLMIRSGSAFKPLEDRIIGGKDLSFFGVRFNPKEGLLGLSREDIEKNRITPLGDIAAKLVATREELSAGTLSIPSVKSFPTITTETDPLSATTEIRTVEIKVDNLLDELMKAVHNYEINYYNRPKGFLCSYETFMALNHILSTSSTFAVHLKPDRDPHCVNFMDMDIRTTRSPIVPIYTFIPYE